MEELPSLLLPLLLLAMSIEPVLSETGGSGDRFQKILAGGLLLLSALAAFVTGPLEFHGPALFVLDSFHQIRFELQAGWLTIGLLGAFVCYSVWEQRASWSRNNRLTVIATALFLLADHFALQLLAGVWLFVLLLREAVRKHESAGVAAGLGLFAMLFLLLCAGLLAFDVGADSWSGLTSTLQANDNWSAHELSLLKLASFFLIFSVVILTGLAPLQALWIAAERREAKLRAREFVSFLLAIGLLDRGRGLLIWASTSQFAVSLAFVTFLMAALCAPFQLGSQRIARTLFASNFALAMTGMLGTDDVAFAAGVCHAIVSCGVFIVHSDENFVRSNFARGMTLLIPFGGLSGAFLLLNAGTPAGIGFELLGLLAWMTLGLTQTQYVRNRQISAVDRTGNPPLLPMAVMLGIAPVVTWGSVTAQSGISAAIERIWLIPEAILAGVTGIAIGWTVGCARPAGEWLAERVPGVSRIFERQFYLREFVLGTVRIPGGICLASFEWGREGVLRAIRLWKNFRSQRHESHEESARWELLRGLACAAVLLIVFLWMGR
ncbi:MAG TPA: hypothetical protein VLA12_10705 [Planctomycetaceae bacterium]|nr:hypothetical protein [Planctomycetaceae bacterium]